MDHALDYAWAAANQGKHALAAFIVGGYPKKAGGMMAAQIAELSAEDASEITAARQLLQVAIKDYENYGQLGETTYGPGDIPPWATQPKKKKWRPGKSKGGR